MYFEGILSLTKFRKVFVKRLQASSDIYTKISDSDMRILRSIDKDLLRVPSSKSSLLI